MKNFTSKGETLTLTAPTGGVVAGSAYLIGAVTVIAHEDAEESAPFVGLTSGVFGLETASTPSEGAAAYITSANAIVTTATGNTKIGAFVSAKDADGVAQVLLTGQV